MSASSMETQLVFKDPFSEVIPFVRRNHKVILFASGHAQTRDFNGPMYLSVSITCLNSVGFETWVRLERRESEIPTNKVSKMTHPHLLIYPPMEGLLSTAS